MLTKEFLFTAPFVIVLLDWLVMGAPLKTACRRALPHVLCLPIIPALIVLTAWAQHQGHAGASAALNITNPYGPGYQYHYALTQPSVILAYLRLILLPYGLNLDPDFPLCTTPLHPRFFISVLAIVAMVVGTWLWYRQQPQGVRRSLIFFGVLWFLINSAPDSSVVPLPDLMVEHRSYLPSIGAFCALACCADLLRTHFSHLRAAHHVIVGYAGAWIVALCAGTFFRHEAWSSEVRIWEDAVTKSPNKLRPLINLGTAYYEAGKPVEATACFQRVLQIQPTCAVAYLNLAKMMNTASRFQDARAVLQAGIRHVPNDAELHFELGVSQCGLGQLREGEKSFQEAILLRATHVRSHLILGLIYAKFQQYEKALEYFRKADALQPLDPQSREIVSQIKAVLRQSSAGPQMTNGPREPNPAPPGP
jgi:tetratricopeptide (TPR) repeat protein